MRYYRLSVFILIVTIVLALSHNLFGTSIELFIASEVTTLLSGIFCLLMLLTITEARTNFFFVSAAVILVSNPLGLLNTFTSTYWSDRDMWTFILSENNTNYEDLIEARIYTDSFCLAFLIIGYLLQASSLTMTIYKKSVEALNNNSIVLKITILLLLIIQLYLIYGGHVVYGGTDFDLEGKASHPLTAFVPLVPTVVVWAGYKLRNTSQIKFAKVFYISILLFEAYWFFLFGRRSIVFYFILAFLGLFYTESITLRHIKRNAVAILICTISAYQLINLFQKIRVYQGYNVAQKTGVIETLKLLQVDESEYKVLNKQNITLRSSYGSFILSFYVDLYKTKPVEPLYGQIILNSALASTPSNFIIDKSTFLVQEHLYNQHFSLNLGDCSESSILESYLDFSTWGMIVYPAFFFIMIYLFLKIFSNSNKEVSLFIVCSLLLISISMIETNMIIILNSIRSIIFFSLVLSILNRFFGQKSSVGN